MSKEILKTKEEKIIEHAGYKMHQEFKANELDVKYLEYRYFELLKKGLIPKGYKDLTDCRLSHINSVCHSQRNPEMNHLEY